MRLCAMTLSSLHDPSAVSVSCWSIDPNAFPWHGADCDKLRFLLRYALLAPSNHNTQPWKFELYHDRVELFADRSRRLHAIDPYDRELTISCGAALSLLRIAGEAFGCRLAIERLPDQDNGAILAVIHIEEVRTGAVNTGILDAILRRRTNRNAFDPAPITVEERNRLAASMEPSKVRARWVDDDEDRAQLGQIVMAADKIQFENSAFLRELAAWIRPSVTSARDGIPAHAVGISGLAAYVAPLLIRTFDLGDGKAARDEELMRRSPGIIILSTAFDTLRDWLLTGEALGALVIEAERLGLKVSYLNQPCEVPQLRFKLSLFDGVEGSPQMILRLGRAAATVDPSPRRPLEEVLRERFA
jgi:nitroreductase